MRTAIVCAAAGFLLAAGCATVDEQAAQVVAAYGPYCDKLGYQPNTDAWRLCIQLEDAKAAAALSTQHAPYRTRW
jgi:hypothetical protein